MTPRHATPAVLGQNKAYRDTPGPKRGAFIINQFRPVAGMGFVTRLACAPLLPPYHMQVMKTLFTVSEIRVNRGIGKTQNIFMTFQAELIYTLFVIGVKCNGIRSGKKSEIVRSMRVMTHYTFFLFYRAMYIFFPLQFLYPGASNQGI